MDAGSWTAGYLTGVALHHHIRIPQLFPSVIASMSVTGIAADLDWFADLSGVAIITRLSASYAGDVTVSYSFDGRRYTAPVPLAELLAESPAAFRSPDAANPRLYFRFHCAADDADIAFFALWGFREGELDNAV